MPRVPRIDKANLVYHVVNRANGRQQIFHTDNDYKSFENIVREAWERTGMRIYSYAIMPNHWHFAVSPRSDGDLSSFVRWLTLTHTQRHHAFTQTIGSGHLYQGRYKSFFVSTDEYFLALCRYIERNALRARLVQRAEQWAWSSLHKRLYGTEKEKQILEPWLIEEPSHYLDLVNEREDQEMVEQIRSAARRGTPFGPYDWVQRVAREFGLESTLRKQGRPQKGT